MDQDSNPVAGIVLLEIKRQILFKDTVDSAGVFSFENLPRGEYRLLVDERSLEKGFLPPWRQEVVASGIPPAGMFARTVTVPPEGGSFKVDLTVFRSGTVMGHAYGPDEEPVENATIWLRNASRQSENIQISAATDDHGAFEIEVYPGRYRITISTGKEHRLANIPKPFPQDINVLPGSIQQTIIRLVPGPCSIEGTVVDQNGAPVDGVDVQAYYLRDPGELPPDTAPFNWSDSVGMTITDAAGHFSFEGLPVERIQVLVGALASSSEGFNGKRILKRWADPHDFRFTSTDESQTMQSTVERINLFTVRIKVNLDATWAATHQFDSKHVLVKARSEQSGQETDISRDTSGTFVWSCETPCSATKFIVYDRKHTFTPKEEIVHPEPSGSLEVRLAIP